MDDQTLGFVHRYVPGPTPGPDGRSLTLLLLHGTGGDENDLLPLGRALAPSAALLSPRGKVLENGALRFFRRLAEGVFDLPDLTKRTHELADFVGAACARYGLDPRTLVAVGFSNGANIAASTLLLRPGVLAGAVLLRAMVPLVPYPLPALPSTPVFLAAGDQDPIVPASEAERLRALLTAAGATVEFRRSPAGHNLLPGDVKAAAAWLQQLTLA